MATKTQRDILITWKGAICSLRMRRCLISNSWPSRGEEVLLMIAEAELRLCMHAVRASSDTPWRKNIQNMVQSLTHWLTHIWLYQGVNQKSYISLLFTLLFDFCKYYFLFFIHISNVNNIKIIIASIMIISIDMNNIDMKFGEVTQKYQLTLW